MIKRLIRTVAAPSQQPQTTAPTKKVVLVRKGAPTPPPAKPSTKIVMAGHTVPGNFIKTLSIDGFSPTVNMIDRVGNPGRLIIGLDPSLTAFGYVELTEALEILHPSTVKPGKKIGMDRIHFLMDEIIYKRIVYRKHLQEIVVFREDYAYSAGSSSDAVLKELGGVLEYELYKNKVRLITIPIASAKKMATGKGNADKSVVMKEVYKNFGYDGDEHTSDALAVAVTGVCLLNRGKITGLTKPQKEALDALADYDLTPTC